MTLWDKVKDLIPKLVDIKNQLAEGNIYIFSKHYEFNPPSEAERSKLQGVSITQDWEREFTENLHKKMEGLEKKLTSPPSVSENRLRVVMTEASVSTAAELMSARAKINLPTPMGGIMTRQIINQWIELIKPTFPPEARIEVDEWDDIILRIDWKLGNDPERPNKRSRLIRIVISREMIEDCQNFDKAGVKFRKIIENNFSAFNPDHNSLKIEGPPVEEWIISTFDIN